MIIDQKLTDLARVSNRIFDWESFNQQSLIIEHIRHFFDLLFIFCIKIFQSRKDWMIRVDSKIRVAFISPIGLSPGIFAKTFSISKDKPSPAVKQTGSSLRRLESLTSLTLSCKLSFMNSNKSLFSSFVFSVLSFLLQYLDLNLLVSHS